MTYDVEDLFIHLFDIWISSQVSSVKVFGPFFNQVFAFLVVEF